MNTVEEFALEAINRDVKAILAELDELLAAKYDQLDPQQLAKNNEAFIQLLDQLNAIDSPFKR